MVSAAGIHLDGMGKPTEIQISQCWVFNHARGIYMTVRTEPMLDPGAVARICERASEDSACVQAHSGCPTVRPSILHITCVEAD